MNQLKGVCKKVEKPEKGELPLRHPQLNQIHASYSYLRHVPRTKAASLHAASEASNEHKRTS